MQRRVGPTRQRKFIRIAAPTLSSGTCLLSGYKSTFSAMAASQSATILHAGNGWLGALIEHWWPNQHDGEMRTVRTTRIAGKESGWPSTNGNAICSFH